MALINCKECGAQVSDTALKCTNCGFQLRKPRRGFFGFIFKWTFVAFNVVMFFWVLSYFGQVGNVIDNSHNQYEQAGAVIGAAAGTNILLSIWLIVDVILGLFVLLTRPKS